MCRCWNLLYFFNMSIRNFLIVVFTLLLSSHLSAQNSQDDVVYLNNGTFLRGKIVKLVTGKSLRLAFNNKDTLEIPLSDVKLIRKENAPVVTNDNYKNSVRAWEYTCIAELNFGLGLLEGLDRYKDTARSQYSVLLSVVNGYTITPYIQLGIGTGLEFWMTRVFLPIYMDFRTNIYKSDNSPFMYLNIGYSLGWMQGNAGGGLGGAKVGIGAGAKFRIIKKQVMVLSLGYNLQQTRQWQVNNKVETKATRDAHFAIFKVGVIF